jgi:hypothetical protein
VRGFKGKRRVERKATRRSYFVWPLRPQLLRFESRAARYFSGSSKDTQSKLLEFRGLKMAVPAQEERHRGAIPASELALAGAIYVRASDELSCDWLTFGLSTHILNASHYTPLV